MVDHPSAADLVLSDGEPHTVLAFRAMHSPPYRPSGAPPSPATGCPLVDLHVTDSAP